MEKYILDTNTWIEHFHQRSGVTQHIMELPTTQIFVSEVTLAELTFGAYYSDDFERHINGSVHVHCSLYLLFIPYSIYWAGTP